MNLSFSNTIGQLPRHAAMYLFGSKDSNGEYRSDIEILHGSIEGVLKIAERVPYNEQFKLFTGGFAPTDNPSSSELSCVAQNMLRYAYAGFSPERFAFYICVHRKKVKPEDMTKAEWGLLSAHFSEIYRTDMHGLFANVDLQNGRPFNIAPRPRMPGYIYLGAMHDWRNGFARPGDPRRARLYSPGDRKAFVARLRREGRSPEESIKDFLGRICKEGIDSGELRSHADIEEFLSYFGDLKSETRDSITLQESESGLFVRLKGKAFHHDFSPTQIVRVDPVIFIRERLEAIEYNKAYAYQGGAIRDASFDPNVSDGRFWSPQRLHAVEKSDESKQKFEEALRIRAIANIREYDEKAQLQGVGGKSIFLPPVSNIKGSKSAVDSPSDSKILRLLPRPDPWKRPPKSWPDGKPFISEIAGVPKVNASSQSFSIVEEDYDRQNQSNCFEVIYEQFGRLGEKIDELDASRTELGDARSRRVQSLRDGVASIENDGVQFRKRISQLEGNIGGAYARRKRFADASRRVDEQMEFGIKGFADACAEFDELVERCEAEIKDFGAQCEEFAGEASGRIAGLRRQIDGARAAGSRIARANRDLEIMLSRRRSTDAGFTPR